MSKLLSFMSFISIYLVYRVIREGVLYLVIVYHIESDYSSLISIKEMCKQV